MTNKQLIDHVLKMVSDSDHIKYEGVSIGQALKVMFHSYLWTFEVTKNRRRGRLQATLRWVGVVCKRFGVGLFLHTQRRVDPSLKKGRGRIAVVCDHSNHVLKMTHDLLDQFQKEDILFVTSSRRVYSLAKEFYPFCIDLHQILNSVNWKRLFAYWRCYSQLRRCVQQVDVLFQFQFFLLICSILQAIEYYKEFFDAAEIDAVVTMSDRHWHEYVITKVAQQRGIRTYTNQHGEFADPIDYIPIASDEIFVWGDISRRFLLENGVPPSQVFISGNPKFDRVNSIFLPQKKEYQTQLQKKHNLNPEQLTVVLLSSGISPEIPENRVFEIVKCFCQATDIPVNLLIKLHPNPNIDNPDLYENWLNSLDLLDRVKILQSDDLFEILAGTDVAVTLLSTTGLEALGFHIPTIMLDILEEVDLREYVTFMDDTILCQSSQEFYSILSNLVENPDHLNAEIERTQKSSLKYFKNSESFNTSEFVKHHILSSINRI